MDYTIQPPPAQPNYSVEPPAQPKYSIEPPAAQASAYSVEPPAQAPEAKSSALEAVATTVKNIPGAQAAGLKAFGQEYGKEFQEDTAKVAGDFQAPVKGQDGKKPGVMDYAARAGTTGLDVASKLWDLTGAHAASKTFLGRPAEELSGGRIKPETVANITDIVAPFGGEIGKVAKLGKEALASRFARPARAAELGGARGGAAMPKEGPLSRAPALNNPREFENQLFQLESNKVADRLDVMKSVKNAPKVEPAVWEKLYHHEENPEGVKLTPEEQQVYDQHVAPIKAEADKLHSELEGYGYDVEPEKGYTPRYVAGRTRSYGEVLDQWKRGVESKFQGGSAGRSMRQTVDAQKSRRFYNAVSPDGEKVVVHVGKDGKVSGFTGEATPRAFGTFGKGQKLGPGAKIKVDGETWRLDPATTKEIEDVAATRYHKNVLANRLDNLAKLRSATRNARFIQAMKESPEWHNVAVKTTDAPLEPPVTNGRQWRVSKMPQFQGYYMEPSLADALDDAVGRQHDLDGIATGLDKAGNLVKGSIFWNPIPHMRNVANHYFVDKGLLGTAKSFATGSAEKALLRAARAVMTQNEDYTRALRAGASLPYARTITADLHKALTTKLGESVTQNPKEWAGLAKIAGYADPIAMIKALYKTSNKALWSFGDILTMARQMERMEKGLPLEKAIKATEEHMPNYRVPSKVAGSRMISQLLQSPVATMFGRYQYNRLASYLNMARDMVSKETSIKDKAAAMDKLAMLGVMLTLYYPMLDKAWQGITGNKNAKVTRPGAASVPQAGIDVAKGDKTVGQAATSVFSPGVVEAPIELFHGRYLWNGQPIAYPENLTDGHPDQFAEDIGSWIGSKVSPVGQAQRIVTGKQTPEQFFLSQIGVSTPTDEAQANKEKYQARDKKYAAHRAEKQRALRNAP